MPTGFGHGAAGSLTTRCAFETEPEARRGPAEVCTGARTPEAVKWATVTDWVVEGR